eukprot:4543383-Prymnesium_polylepis.1
MRVAVGLGALQENQVVLQNLQCTETKRIALYSVQTYSLYLKRETSQVTCASRMRPSGSKPRMLHRHSVRVPCCPSVLMQHRLSIMGAKLLVLHTQPYRTSLRPSAALP